MTIKELIEKLNKFNPDGTLGVVTRYSENDCDQFDEITRFSIEEMPDGQLAVVIHTDYMG